MIMTQPPIVTTPPEGEYVCLAGSRAYGTETETSDYDYRGFFMPTLDQLFGVGPDVKSQVTQAQGRDDAMWEIRGYVKMAMAANPNVLETLFVPLDKVVFMGDIANMLHDHRQQFLSQRIARTYFGYAMGNYRRVLKQTTVDRVGPFGYDGKDAMHLVRLVRTGLETLRTGELRVARPEDRELFLEIKASKVPFEEIQNEFLEAEGLLPGALKATPLPKEPDEVAINELLVQLMAEYVREQLW